MNINPRYQIWNKKDVVYTPSGEKYTAEQWIEKYPVAATLKTVCGGGEIKGEFFMVFSAMVDYWARKGCDFSECVEDQDYLDAIEVFEDMINTPSDEPTAEERIAAAVELQALASLPDVEE